MQDPNDVTLETITHSSAPAQPAREIYHDAPHSLSPCLLDRHGKSWFNCLRHLSDPC